MPELVALGNCFSDVMCTIALLRKISSPTRKTSYDLLSVPMVLYLLFIQN